MGKCPSCQQWNTFAEEVVQKESVSKNDWRQQGEGKYQNKPRTLTEIESGSEIRLKPPEQPLPLSMKKTNANFQASKH